MPAIKCEASQLLAEFIETHRPITVLTGAGCSTDSGIPDYRDREGNWKYSRPVQFLDFINDIKTRKRYWSRSAAGWPEIANAQPNTAHHSLTRLEQDGYIRYLVTQNVDGLHQKAGTRAIMDLHGRIDNVVCLQCKLTVPRAEIQELILELNPDFEFKFYRIGPDGDAIPGAENLASFKVPVCPVCDGILKPDVVFFGEQVPKYRVESVLQELEKSHALLVIGSSLMVFSGYRFCKSAKEMGKPVAILNIGKTRADDKIDMKIELPCGPTLKNIALSLISTKNS